MMISELLQYGRYYRDENDSNHIWWFDPIHKQIYQYETLLSMFGYKSQQDILDSGMFIPLFETDILQLEREFVLETQSKKTVRYFNNISDFDLDREFKVFIEKNFLIKSWMNYEKKHLYQDALEWCKSNHLTDIFY